jgi:hypothetical protein
VALRETLEPMQALESPGTVNLVPLFDAYAVGLGRGAELEPVLAKAYQSQVYRPQGWISAVVLVDGYFKGIWEYGRQRQQTAVKIHMFAPLTVSIRNGIEAEVERLGVFLNSKVAVEYEGAAQEPSPPARG